jgi:anti-sigma regulatory factor (Ser/Thr protein kinase)
LRATLGRWLQDSGAGEQETYDILTAVGEAVTNVIRHASSWNGGRFTLEAERGSAITVVIRDRGRWRPEDEARPGGQGLRIMRAFMDGFDIETHADGTVVTLRKELALAQGGS